VSYNKNVREEKLLETFDLASINDKYYNKIKISGRISDIVEGKRKGFKNYWLKVKNKEGNLEEFRLYMPAKDLSGFRYELGDFVSVNGKIFSYNVSKFDGSNRLILSLYSKDVTRISKEESEKKEVNEGIFVGYVSKRPFIRELGNGVAITESILGITDEETHKNFYIPFLVSGENAFILKHNCNVGDRIAIKGLFRERKFKKKIDDKVIESRAYEVEAKDLYVLNRGREYGKF